MKILLLTKDPIDADKFLEEFDPKKIWVIKESDVNEGNLIEEGAVDYYQKITTKLKNIALNFSAESRQLIIVTNMLNYLAVEEIPHDLSILIYDNSKKRNLSYNIKYKTDYIINSIDKNSVSQLQNSIFS